MTSTFPKIQCHVLPDTLSVSWERHLVRKLTSNTTLHPNTVYQLLHKTKVLYQKSWFYMIHLFFPTKKKQLPLKHKKNIPHTFLSLLNPELFAVFNPTLAPSSPTWLCAIFKVRRVEFEAKAVDKACEIENDVRWMRCWRENSMFQTKFNKKLAWEMVNQNRFGEIDLSQVYIQ